MIASSFSLDSSPGTMVSGTGSEPKDRDMAVTMGPGPPFSAEAQGQSLTFYPAGADRREALMEIVASAKERLDICFYIFAEDRVSAELRDALAEAARRGVAVTLIIDRFGASASDSFLQPLVGGKPLSWLDLRAGVAVSWATAPPSQAFLTYRNGQLWYAVHPLLRSEIVRE